MVKEFGLQEQGEVRVGFFDLVGGDGVEVGDVRGDVWAATAVVGGHRNVRSVTVRIKKSLEGFGLS